MEDSSFSLVVFCGVGGYDGNNFLTFCGVGGFDGNDFLTFCRAGGYDGNDFLTSVEMYNPETNEWTEVTNMPCGRSGHGVAVGAEPPLR